MVGFIDLTSKLCDSKTQVRRRVLGDLDVNLPVPALQHKRVTKLSLSKNVQRAILGGTPSVQVTPTTPAPPAKVNHASDAPPPALTDVLQSESQHENYAESRHVNNVTESDLLDPNDLRIACEASLPSDYEHLVVAVDQAHPYPAENINRSGMFTALLRVNLRTKEDALQWLADYQMSSSTDWRVRRVFPENTPCIIFKKGFRCHNNTLAQYRSETKQCRYKHTQCEASVMITVKNFEMTRSSDEFLKTKPCEIVIHNFHNHQLATADSLRLRRPTKEVEDAFLGLYRSGHSPSTAYRTFSFDLQMKHGDEFFKVLAENEAPGRARVKVGKRQSQPPCRVVRLTPPCRFHGPSAVITNFDGGSAALALSTK